MGGYAGEHLARLNGIARQIDECLVAIYDFVDVFFGHSLNLL